MVSPTKKISNTLGLLLLLSISIDSFPAWSQENIAGIWSASIRTKGGIASQWTFFEDSTVTYTFGALVDFKYSIDNNKIRMTPLGTESDEDNEIIQEYSIKGETLTILHEGSEEPQIMTWAGVPAKTEHPLVGNWTYEHYTGFLALMRYSSHGLGQLTVPFTVKNGTYSIQGDMVVIKFRNQETFEFEFKRNGNRLSLHDVQNDKSTEYKLFEY